MFIILIVPLDPNHLSPLGSSIRHAQPRQDHRLREKNKWYTKPVVFGGDPSAGDNMTWVNLERHIQLVNWWNKLYQTMKDQTKEEPQ